MDLKPENILVTANNTVKICDMGFIRKLDKVLNTIKDNNSYKSTRQMYTP